jgi:hypothetical protein
MIMVRRNELACRDEWAKSLWEPATGGAGQEKPFQRAANLGPAVPASLDNVRSLLNADTTVASSTVEGEDVLLSEGRIVSEAPLPRPAPGRPKPAGGFDPRTAVIKAREAYRERSRAREAAARKSAGIEALEEPDDSRLPVRVQSHEVPHEGAVQRNGSGTRVADVRRPRLSRPPAEAQPEPTLLHSEFEDIPISEPVREHWPVEYVRSPEDETTRQGIELAQAELPAETGTAERGSEQSEQALPEWFRTDLPRICRTCRDYRPAAEGGRGWCANAWAFTHRRLVQDDDAAPCDSAVGDWWAPVDDVWLVAADVSSHGRATPLLDRLTAEERSQRRRS